MTDDCTPIELSLGWRSEPELAAVKYSIEPIGLLAGTTSDTFNEYVTTYFIHRLQQTLPGTDLTCFNHFSKHLLSYRHPPSTSDEPSRLEKQELRTCSAFDLLRTHAVPVAYFLPSKAAETGQSSLDVISQSIEDIPKQQGSDF